MAIFCRRNLRQIFFLHFWVLRTGYTRGRREKKGLKLFRRHSCVALAVASLECLKRLLRAYEKEIGETLPQRVFFIFFFPFFLFSRLELVRERSLFRNFFPGSVSFPRCIACTLTTEFRGVTHARFSYKFFNSRNSPGEILVIYLRTARQWIFARLRVSNDILLCRVYDSSWKKGRKNRRNQNTRVFWYSKKCKIFYVDRSRDNKKVVARPYLCCSHIKSIFFFNSKNNEDSRIYQKERKKTGRD